MISSDPLPSCSSHSGHFSVEAPNSVQSVSLSSVRVIFHSDPGAFPKQTTIFRVVDQEGEVHERVADIAGSNIGAVDIPRAPGGKYRIDIESQQGNATSTMLHFEDGADLRISIGDTGLQISNLEFVN